MPLYEFQCKKCKENFEISCSLKEYEETKPSCPKCKSKEVSRRISLFFAKTDSKT
ncbi:MAG: zinc ribbon domain-containing protein [Candidatus Omnitrophica bacterium]|nr:zinc ribbon domain-containing protein [Candidatus Omnitrophota bacterium]